VRSLFTACRLIPIPKKDGTIRPIAIPEVFFKIAGKYISTLRKSCRSTKLELVFLEELT